MIQMGQIAMDLASSRMADISGMNKTVKKERQVEVHHIVSKEDMKGFVDFLKEIFE